MYAPQIVSGSGSLEWTLLVALGMCAASPFQSEGGRSSTQPSSEPTSSVPSGRSAISRPHTVAVTLVLYLGAGDAQGLFVDAGGDPTGATPRVLRHRAGGQNSARETARERRVDVRRVDLAAVGQREPRAHALTALGDRNLQRRRRRAGWYRPDAGVAFVGHRHPPAANGYDGASHRRSTGVRQTKKNGEPPPVDGGVTKKQKQKTNGASRWRARTCMPRTWWRAVWSMSVSTSSDAKPGASIKICAPSALVRIVVLSACCVIVTPSG